MIAPSSPSISQTLAFPSLSDPYTIPLPLLSLPELSNPPNPHYDPLTALRRIPTIKSSIPSPHLTPNNPQSTAEGPSSKTAVFAASLGATAASTVHSPGHLDHSCVVPAPTHRSQRHLQHLLRPHERHYPPFAMHLERKKRLARRD